MQVPVPADFDARHCCTGRTYKYFFVREDYDVAAMARAAEACRPGPFAGGRGDLDSCRERRR